jgi:hypothetical protein
VGVAAILPDGLDERQVLVRPLDIELIALHLYLHY